MAKLFDPILISSRTGLVKPDPAALAQLTGLGVPPDTVLYVDDRAPARAAARAWVSPRSRQTRTAPG